MTARPPILATLIAVATTSSGCALVLGLDADHAASSDASVVSDVVASDSRGHDAAVIDAGDARTPDSGPTILAAGESSPRLLGTDGTYLYWTAGQQFRRILVTGGNAATVHSESFTLSSAWLDTTTADASALEWQRGTPFELVAATTASLALGAAPQVLDAPDLVGCPVFFQSQPAPAADQRYVYFVVPNCDQNLMTYDITRVPKSQGPASTAVHAANTIPNTPYNLTVDSTSIYWTIYAQAGVFSAANDGTSSVVTELSTDTVNAIVQVSDDLYLTDISSSSVRKLPKAGGPASDLAVVQPGPRYLATDGVTMYWSLDQGNTIAACGITAPCGASPRTVVSPQKGAITSIAVDDENLYFSTEGAIFRSPK